MKKLEKYNEAFRKFAHRSSEYTGTPWVFTAAIVVIVLWGLSGPIFGFSDTWQLIINTSTTIITFLMVFLIQNTHNRESRAVQLKLDELIKSVKGARNNLIKLEELSDKQLDSLQNQFERIKRQKSPDMDVRN